MGDFDLRFPLLFIFSSKSLTPIIPLRHVALQPTKPIWQSKKANIRHKGHLTRGKKDYELEFQQKYYRLSL